MPMVFVQEWIESEAGWGQRPDGYKLYTTLENAKLGTKKDLDEQKKYFDKTLGPGIVPHEYSRPCGEPTTISVSTKTMEKVERAGINGFYVNHLSEVEYKEDTKPTRPMRKVKPPVAIAGKQHTQTKEMFAVNQHALSTGRYSMNPGTTERIALPKAQKNTKQEEFVEVQSQSMIDLKNLSEDELAKLLSRATTELLNRRK